MQLINFLQKKYNKTVIIIEHRIEDVLECKPDKIVIIDEGEIKACDSPDKILKANILKKYGLREPLYIEALKHYNIDLNLINNIHCIDSFKDKEISKYISPKIDYENPNQNCKVKDTPILSVKNLKFSYDPKEKLIIKGVDFNIYKGEIISILGNNGAGKSTLSQLITGILKPNEGEIILRDTNISKMSIREIGQKIGYVMQNPNHMIIKHMIKDEISLGLESAGYGSSYIEKKYKEVIETCGLYGYRKWPISSLSYGQKKRVTIASILALEPEVIIFDEPTAGQDYKTYTSFMEFIKQISDSGISIILITHDMHLALEYSTRSLVLSNGILIGNDTPSNILTNKDIVKKANLKETTLGILADTLNLKDKNMFIQEFIDFEKKERSFA